MATISERIAEALELREMKQADLVKATGIGKSSISTYLSGEYEPKQKNIYKIAKALNVSEAWLMGLDVPMNRIKNIIPLKKDRRIPLLGRIACGEPILAQENIEEMILLPDDVNADFALTCQGDSMINARINDGDIVYVLLQPQVENGEIAAVLIGDEATLKRFYQQGDTVILKPENSKYEPLVFTKDEINNADISIIGKATYFLSKVD